MPKTVKANRAQVRAARLLVKRASRGIGSTSPALRAIAEAERPRSGEPARTGAAAPDTRR